MAGMVIETMWQDICFSARILSKNPGFTAAAVLILALGIGPNITIFALVEANLLQPLPIQNLDNLVLIQANDRLTSRPRSFSYQNYLKISERNAVFSEVIAEGQQRLNGSRDGVVKPVRATAASENYFGALDISPEQGRFFSPADCLEDSTCSLAVLSYQFWDRQYGSDPRIVGQEILLSGRTFSIIGVAARGFHGTDKLQRGTDLWLPLKAVRMLRLEADKCGACEIPLQPPRKVARVVRREEENFDREHLWLRCVGVLRSGSSLDEAEANLGVLAWQLEKEFPVENSNLGISAWFLGEGDPILRFAGIHLYLLLFVVVGFVFFTACANVGNLLLARGSARHQEFVMRTALGAGRWRLIRQLLFENLLLSLLAGSIALLLAFWSLKLLATLNLAGGFFRVSTAQLNLPVLGFAFFFSVVTAIVFGLSPVLQISKIDLMTSLRGDPGTSSTDRRGTRSRNKLVATQIAASIVLLSCTGLFVQVVRSVRQNDLGFQTENLLIGALDFSPVGYSESETQSFLHTLATRLRANPSIQEVAFAHRVPLEPISVARASLRARTGEARENNVPVKAFVVTPEFFPVFKIPILHGRNFEKSDFDSAAEVGLVNQTMAQQFWPDENPLGKTFDLRSRLSSDSKTFTVVGVVGNGTYRRMGEKPEPGIYRLYQQPGSVVKVVVLSSGDPISVLPTLRDEVRWLDSSVVLTGARTGKAHLEGSLRLLRIVGALFGILGGLAMLLGIIGIYAIASFNVSRKTRDYAIRMTYGANKSDILRLALKQMVKPSITGLVAGLVIAALIVRGLASLFYGIGDLDLLSLFIFVSVLLIMSSAGATLLAATRATRMNPMTVLRHE